MIFSILTFTSPTLFHPPGSAERLFFLILSHTRSFPQPGPVLLLPPASRTEQIFCLMLSFIQPVFSGQVPTPPPPTEPPFSVHEPFHHPLSCYSSYSPNCLSCVSSGSRGPKLVPSCGWRGVSMHAPSDRYGVGIS